MSENLLIAVIGIVSAIGGSIATQLFTAAKTQIETYRMLLELRADNQRLWAWNRSLVDHIYKGLGPPPPEPPDDLFDHEQ